MKTNKVLASLLVSALLSLTACGGDDEAADARAADTTEHVTGATSTMGEVLETGFAAVDAERLTNASSEPGQWMSHGGDYNEQRFVQLDQISPDNVDQLGLTWFADLETNRGQQSTPLMVDSVIYVSESWSKVSAFDAVTGERLWFYDPKVPGEKGSKGCCDVVNRGVAVWEGKVYVGSYDGRIIALNAETGEELWSEVTVDQDGFYSVTGAPRVANGKVFIGMAGGEYITRGYISAYDANTGEMVWRFYTVPGNPELGFESDAMEMAAETWTGDWWELGGGGTTWDGVTYDPETNLLYFGVGNGSPWNAKLRSPEGGDNLFTVSIVAVNADTGEYVWHFQEIPEEQWDFDAVQQITVADIEIDGTERHVLMQAAKSGYYYMLDASTGELLVAENFVPVNWTFGYDMETGRPILNPAAMYTENDGPTISQPGPVGAHVWHPMSYSPDTELLYIPARSSSIAYTDAPDIQMGNFSLGVAFFGGDSAYDEPGNTIPRGGDTKLLAWNPVKGEEVWSVIQQGTPSGILTTSGDLLFQGYSAEQKLIAYKASTGEELWSTDVKATIAAGPISYSVAGEQYVAQVVGGTSQGGGYYEPTYARLLVYKLGGDAVLPEKIDFVQRPFDPPEQTGSAALIAEGAATFNSACALCHDDQPRFPDLRRTPMLTTAASFDAVVLQGTLSERGMISYADNLSAEDTTAIRAYLIDEAEKAKNAPAFPFGLPPGA